LFGVDHRQRTFANHLMTHVCVGIDKPVRQPEFCDDSGNSGRLPLADESSMQRCVVRFKVVCFSGMWDIEIYSRAQMRANVMIM